MTTEKANSIRMTHAALDDENGEIILRGVIDPESLAFLKIAEYQREVQPSSTIRKLAEALKCGSSVPDIDLGMRGGNYREREGTFFLQDDVYVIDGLQRKTAAQFLMKEGKKPRLGAVVHFNTTEVYERKRFRILNLTQQRVSPNVLLRNLRVENEFIEMLFLLCNSTDFALYHKVCWEQSLHRDHLITALNLVKTVAHLHRALGPGMSSNHGDLAENLNRTMRKVSRKVIRDNVLEFWRVVDDCFGVRVVTYREGATHLRGSFLRTLAKLFADHENFWKGSNLYLDSDMRRKLATFPLKDPQVVQLAGASGASGEILYILLRDHINKGKTTKRLVELKKKKGEVIDTVELAVTSSKEKVMQSVGAI